MKQMQGLDATFVAIDTPNTPAHIGSIAIYDPSTAPGGFVRFKDILKFIRNRLRKSVIMRQKMVKVPFGLDHPYWVQDSNFDLENHVGHVALPKPGDWRQLCILSARIFSRPLDLTRPPWEITVIEGLDNIKDVPRGSYAMLTKVHHSAIDGVSGMDMMQALHTLDADISEPDEPDRWKPEADPSQLGLFARAYLRGLKQPITQIRALRHTLPGIARVSRGLIKRDFDFTEIAKTPKTRFNVMVSPHRIFNACTFKFSDIKRIRDLAEDSKINDVMLSIVGGGVRNYLLAKNDLPATSLTAMAPISVRSKSEKNTMGNQVSAMFVPLGSHIENAVERLQYVTKETRQAKQFTEALGARQMSEMSKLSSTLAMNLGVKISGRLKLADKIKPMVNTVVTNVPGPPVEIYSSGAKLVGLYGQFCLMDGIGVGHVIQSYMNDITLSFTACRNVIPDPELYNECMQKSFDAHLKAAEKITEKSANKSADK
ncbi:MAG: wax ester/triacylglycerol synthase family O-acyltransferase [Robiginitomaculum sp.]|nr:wax ester/triacylglycerol synthase family O-acyltransferase [Robiginitomaculum sp.]